MFFFSFFRLPMMGQKESENLNSWTIIRLDNCLLLWFPFSHEGKEKTRRTGTNLLLRCIYAMHERPLKLKKELLLSHAFLHI